MAFPTIKMKILESEFFTPKFVDDLVMLTMSKYYSSQEIPVSPTSGYCIPIEPEIRLTDSPTGGIIGRHLAVAMGFGTTSHTTLSETTGANGSPVMTPKANRVVKSEVSQLQGQVETGVVGSSLRLNQSATVSTLLASIRKLASRHVPVSSRRSLTARPLFTEDGDPLPASTSGDRDDHSSDIASDDAPTRKRLAVEPPSQGSASKKQLSLEDRHFLMKTLNRHISKASTVVPMAMLVPVHQDRPGKHILRMDPHTGELYACIPFNPFAPEDKGIRQDYNLDSYESFFQETGYSGRRAQKPYPAVGNSSLNTCNHCGTPTRILNNVSLCPFHAYYLATGAFLRYYEFCALVEMEKQGRSLASGWWTIEGMVRFVEVLKKRVDKWIFLAESTDIPAGSWQGHASPYGAVGEPVPLPAQGKTAYRVAIERKLTEAASRHTKPVTREKTAAQIRDEQTLVTVLGRQLGMG